jgi:hypothetical protein
MHSNCRKVAFSLLFTGLKLSQRLIERSAFLCPWLTAAYSIASAMATGGLVFIAGESKP